MKFENFSAPKNNQEAGADQEGTMEILRKFSGTRAGKAIMFLGAALALKYASPDNASAEEYKGVLTDSGRARIEAIKKQRGQNIVDARNQAVEENNIESITTEVLSDGSKAYHIITGDGVKIEAVDPADSRDAGEEKARSVSGPKPVSKSGLAPQAVKNPYL